ncbi:lipoyl(octanoyl) transferase LipB [Rhodococcus sp. WS4]|nr:lipoyl(octanoyl) transferase LipB [Rhodococcus sp. WS4]
MLNGLHSFDRQLRLEVNTDPVPYCSAMERMQEMFLDRQNLTMPDTLWLLSHPPVFTVGVRTRREHLPASTTIPVVHTKRGGQLTYHGPGQLVGYLVVGLRSHEGVVDYVREVETRLVHAIEQLGVPAERRDTPIGSQLLTGVWARNTGRKIASIGMRSGRGVTTHGFSINVIGDLSPWNQAVPCGMPDVEMTSLEHELIEVDRPVPDMRQVRSAVASAFEATKTVR